MNKVQFLLFGCMTLFSVTVVAQSEKQPIVCNNTYALCSAASCQPIPGLPEKVLCTCSIWTGKNIGFSSCSTRKEKLIENGQKALISTFSLGGGHYRFMTCPAETPWADCLDKSCFVDKQSLDGRRAICTCDIMHHQAYVTFAGECDQTNCHKAIWSGATPEGNQQLMSEFAKATGREITEVCPIHQKL